MVKCLRDPTITATGAFSVSIESKRGSNLDVTRFLDASRFHFPEKLLGSQSNAEGNWPLRKIIIAVDAVN
jgi:hypothetical protein